MKGLRTAVIAQKKPNAEMLKTRKAATKTTKEKASKKNSTSKDPGAPKRPPSAFFIFMEEFRKSFKENFPDNKSVSVVGKAGGEKWKTMSDSEKASYADKALKKKAEYEKAREAYEKHKCNNNGENENMEESEKSTSEVHDEAEQEASS